MESVDLQQVHDFLIEVAYKAGARISSAEPSEAETGTKKNSADLVTETDQEVEDLVSKTLREKYPTFHFMGEETYKEGDKLTDEPTFVVDPIDGTNVSESMARTTSWLRTKQKPSDGTTLTVLSSTSELLPRPSVRVHIVRACHQEEACRWRGLQPVH